ncbi:exported hypothetical protein [Gammaproteobacteria bacterium]
MTPHPSRFFTPHKLALAVSLALAGPSAWAVDYYVGKNTDNGLGNTAVPDCANASNTTCQLSDAILAANTTGGSNTITLTTDVTITGVMKRLINSDITLQSDGTTRIISGGGAFRPLFIKSGPVTIKNLNLSNGKAKGGDGNYGGGWRGFGRSVVCLWRYCHRGYREFHLK